MKATKPQISAPRARGATDAGQDGAILAIQIDLAILFFIRLIRLFRILAGAIEDTL